MREKPLQKQKHTQENGNVLIFILIAVFLLGALTAMFVRSSGKSEETGSTERGSIYASAIVRNSAATETAIHNLLTRGCSESELNFYTTSSGAPSANPSAPTDNSCDIYNVAGGGLTPYINATSYPYFTTGDVSNIGSTAADLIEVVAYDNKDDAAVGLSDETCKSLNNALGNGFSFTALPSADLTGGSRFTGSFSGAPQYGYGGGSVAMDKIKAGCITDTGCNSGAGCYSFYNIILKR